MNPLIAINILPGSIDEIKSALGKAQAQGFSHAWLNPLSSIGNVPVHRIDLDTGVMTNLSSSMYAVSDLRELRLPYTSENLSELNKHAASLGIKLLADFVWKHVSNDSLLIDKHPKWFKDTSIKDVREYDFVKNNDPLTTKYNHIKHYLQNGIDFLLDNCKFSGLRFDAASNFSVLLRADLMRYVRKKYADAIILEEVLFDDNQTDRIMALAKSVDEAEEVATADIPNPLKSDFVTSNLYYQRANAFGQLPQAHEMGDSLKLKLARLPISFTGNHDHFSLAWDVLLTLAAQKISADYIENYTTKSVFPVKSEKSLSFALLNSLVNKLKTGEIPAEIIQENDGLLKMLVPIAHQLAATLCSQQDEELLSEFRALLYKRLAHRTIVSPGGYFMLQSDMELEFDTQRIFLNSAKESLQTLALTPDILKRLSQESMQHLLSDMGSSSLFDNWKNFLHQIPSLHPKPQKHSKKAIPSDSVEYNETEINLIFPYVLTYLRSLSDASLRRACSDLGLSPLTTFNTDNLRTTIAFDPCIAAINKITASLETIDATVECNTFTSLECITIIVRCLGEKTDIIFLNANPKVEMTIELLDLEKIAIWFQTRKFSPQPDDKGGELTQPCDKKDIVHFNASYSARYQDQKEEFNLAFNRITGSEHLPEGYVTNLYFGCGINPHSELTKINNLRIKHETHSLDASADAMSHPSKGGLFSNHPSTGASTSTSETTSLFYKATS